MSNIDHESEIKLKMAIDRGAAHSFNYMGPRGIEWAKKHFKHGEINVFKDMYNGRSTRVLEKTSNPSLEK